MGFTFSAHTVRRGAAAGPLRACPCMLTPLYSFCVHSAPASFVAEKQLRIVFPSISLGDEKFMQALVEIALDGQTSAPEIQSQLFLYSPPTFEAPNPLWVSAEGGAVVRIKADPLFQSAALRVRLDALL
eukprot:358093-Pleurochrysis_carterae.AAC.1